MLSAARPIACPARTVAYQGRHSASVVNNLRRCSDRLLTQRRLIQIPITLNQTGNVEVDKRLRMGQNRSRVIYRIPDSKAFRLGKGAIILIAFLGLFVLPEPISC